MVRRIVVALTSAAVAAAFILVGTSPAAAQPAPQTVHQQVQQPKVKHHRVKHHKATKHKKRKPAALRISCSTSGSATFAPGVTSTVAPVKIAFSGSYAGCTGNTKIASGSFSGTTSGADLRCATVITPGTVLGTGPETIKWKGGTTSVIKFATIKVGNGNFSISGKVTSGKFKGKHLSSTLVPSKNLIPSNWNCSTIPVTGLTFSGGSRIA